jgi:hypothetical protein
MNTIDVP